MDDLYQEIIIDHGRHPRNKAKLEGATHNAEGQSPMCGDHIELELVVENAVIKSAKFTGDGCAISTASASLMTELLAGMPVDEALKLAGDFRTAIVEGQTEAELGVLEALLPIRAYPMRVKCATLPWVTLQEALK